MKNNDKNKKKLSLKIIIPLLIIPFFGLAHFLAFPQQTRAILIDLSGFEKKGNLYFNPNTNPETLRKVEVIIEQATLNLEKFWGNKIANPKIIYCDNDADFKKYGNPYPVPAVTMVKLGTYIVLSKSGIDTDIIAHEMSHAEFYQRIGFYNTTFKVPSWFDEGLAMQVDHRSYYSEDTLKQKSDNFKKLPDVKKLFTGQQFGTGTLDEIKLNYMTAKHLVKEWYSKEKLTNLINNLNNGVDFERTFK